MQVLRAFFTVALVAVLFSCNNDDDGNFSVAPPRLLSEVATEDAAALQEYLSTHFYNYEDFENPPADFDYRIVLDTIAGENTDKIALIDRPELKSVTVTIESEDFGLDAGETVDHTMYYLSAREGVGGTPTRADSTFLKYEGSLLNGSVFDATSTHVWQYLPFTLRGYREGVSKFKTGDDIIVNPDGTTAISNAGVGVMFIPSGLGYFNTIINGIPSYSPLIFKIEVGLYVENTDYDNDGIPSILEDLDGDGDVTNDNTDVEQERNFRLLELANHVDSDDDQDGTPTRDEIIIDEFGNLTFPDGDGDGIPDYLDRDNP
ncbi:FKBP-type peptidyl-prolyl cis-trans isomerase [Lentiprolixibacter aurantiacus]|uniref:peptidylprolyl isomerase n=1 Tax=Lentiprolixibacter aurantiacus TaxID=2993939 RepID=A0AAE3MLV2_9FLAO|nr:hypothetical protein [Lentiprolixibacter aurantiacus]MCX2720086.1 hypothetical protein [Lentiprolixibacter aurantiacus]